MDPTTQAALDESWLRERLGRRYLGLTEDKKGGGWWVSALSKNGKPIWWWGKTEGEALAKLRGRWKDQ